MKTFTQGLIVCGIGLVYLLRNMGAFDFHIPSLWNLWPLVPLAAGITGLIEGFSRYRIRDWRKIFKSTFWTFVGIIYIGRTLGYFGSPIHGFWGEFWPLFLLWLGMQVLSKGTRTFGSAEIKSQTVGDISLGRREAWTLDEKSINLMAGQIFVDLTKAFIPEAEAHFEASVSFGEITVLVPRELPIRVKAEALAGDLTVLDQTSQGIHRGITFETPGFREAQKKVIINLSVRAGQITVRAL